jgi:hypothetical protein
MDLAMGNRTMLAVWLACCACGARTDLPLNGERERNSVEGEGGALVVDSGVDATDPAPTDGGSEGSGTAGGGYCQGTSGVKCGKNPCRYCVNVGGQWACCTQQGSNNGPGGSCIFSMP